LLAAGILDPAKVVRSEIQNAGSVASLLLTTEAVIVEIPQQDDGGAAGGGGMPGGPMGGHPGMGMM